MTAITIDTYRVVKLLIDKGYSEEQAEGFIEAVEAIDFDQVASKRDLKELEYRLIIKLSGVMLLLLSFFKAMEHFF